MQHFWVGALHKESVALEHKLHFAIVACACLHKLPDLWWQGDLLKDTGPEGVVIMDQAALNSCCNVGQTTDVACLA